MALPEGFGMAWAFEVDGKTLPRNPMYAPLEVYTEHPDSRVSSDVPKGKLTQQAPFKSEVFKDTTRDWWIYVPAQYNGETPAAVMVFQDGSGYKDFVPTVFDNLIAKKEMPVTVGVFVNPGVFLLEPPRRVPGRRYRFFAAATELLGPTAASSTTRSPISTPDSCWKSFSPPPRRPRT